MRLAPLCLGSFAVIAGTGSVLSPGGRGSKVSGHNFDAIVVLSLISWERGHPGRFQSGRDVLAPRETRHRAETGKLHDPDSQGLALTRPAVAGHFLTGEAEERGYGLGGRMFAGRVLD